MCRRARAATRSPGRETHTDVAHLAVSSLTHRCHRCGDSHEQVSDIERVADAQHCHDDELFSATTPQITPNPPPLSCHPNDRHVSRMLWLGLSKGSTIRAGSTRRSAIGRQPSTSERHCWRPLHEVDHDGTVSSERRKPHSQALNRPRKRGNSRSSATGVGTGASRTGCTMCATRRWGRIEARPILGRRHRHWQRCAMHCSRCYAATAGPTSPLSSATTPPRRYERSHSSGSP